MSKFGRLAPNKFKRRTNSSMLLELRFIFYCSKKRLSQGEALQSICLHMGAALNPYALNVQL